MANTKFAIRVLNCTNPNYSEPSTVGNFVEFIILSITSAFNFFLQ
jgi:hypothetical protein